MENQVPYNDVNTTNQLISINEYIKDLKKELPPLAFSANPKKLYIMFFHFLILLICYRSIHELNSIPALIIISLFIGNSLGCLAFLSHELTHNTIIRSKKISYCFEVIFWGVNFIPATVWRRVHNHCHHPYTNTLHDPDREFLSSEKCALISLYSKIFHPHKNALRWNPFVGFHFVPYILRNIIDVFCVSGFKFKIVPFKAKYNKFQRMKVVFEISVIALIQVLLFYFLQNNWIKYSFASLIPALIASTIVMAYVFTNHFLNPIHTKNDPLLGSTTVVVPRILNVLHSNMSYHTEHHLFPNISSDYYPIVSKLLETKYSKRYHRIPILEAWKRLWDKEEFAKEN